MTKKWSVIILMVLFFSAVGAFHYDGSKRVSEAEGNNKDRIIESIQKDIALETKEYTSDNQTNQTIPKGSSEDSSPKKQNIQSTTPEINPSKEKESNLSKEEENNPPSIKESDSPKNNPPNNKGDISSSKEDIFIFDGKTYRLHMDKTKVDPNSNMPFFIDAVLNYGAKIYGLDQTDVFIIVKDGKHIGGFSAGMLSVKIEHANLAKAMYPENRSGYKGIRNNIDLVMETGAHVSVEYASQVEGYSLWKRDGYLNVGTY